MKKPPIRKHIINGKAALKQIMKENLQGITEAMIQQIIARARKATPSTMIDCIKNVDQPGVGAYKSALQSALAVLATDALTQVRREVPKAKHVKLSEPVVDFNHPVGCDAKGEMVYLLDEFSSLPPKIQKKIQVESNLVVQDQADSLAKSIYFQWASSHDSTDSVDILETDITDAASDYVDGNSIDAGAGLMAAELINTTRSVFFSDKDVQAELDALQFINSDPVTDICQDLDGTVFAADDSNADRYQPPLHWNCKSYIVPIIAGNLGNKEITDLKPSSKDLEDDIQFAESKVCRLLTEMKSHL